MSGFPIWRWVVVIVVVLVAGALWSWWSWRRDVRLKVLDGLDAARLLLLPGLLRPGESVAAAVPDADTLIVVSVPASGDWSLHKKLASMNEGEPLLGRPLRVTHGGISLAP